eukprot:10241067-Alexandrium_andersonii.AAC.1
MLSWQHLRAGQRSGASSTCDRTVVALHLVLGHWRRHAGRRLEPARPAGRRRRRSVALVIAAVAEVELVGVVDHAVCQLAPGPT